MGNILTSKDSIFDFLKWQIFQRELIIKRSDCLVWLFGSYEKHLNRRHCLNWFLSVSFVILHFFTLFVLLLKSRDQFDMITGLDYGLCRFEKNAKFEVCTNPFIFVHRKCDQNWASISLVRNCKRHKLVAKSAAEK